MRMRRIETSPEKPSVADTSEIGRKTMRRVLYSSESEETAPLSSETADGDPDTKRVMLFDAQELPPESPDPDELDLEPPAHLPITPEPAPETSPLASSETSGSSESPEPPSPPRRRVLAGSIRDTETESPKIARIVSTDPLVIEEVPIEELEKDDDSSSDFDAYRLNPPRSLRKKKSSESSGNASGSERDAGSRKGTSRHDEVSRRRMSGIRGLFSKIFQKRTPDTEPRSTASSTRETEPRLRPRPKTLEGAPSEAPASFHTSDDDRLHGVGSPVYETEPRPRPHSEDPESTPDGRSRVNPRDVVRRWLVDASKGDIDDYGSF